MTSLKMGGIILAAFVAGAFIASPELRAYAANTIGSADIINESILSEDIKNGQVKAADIATDSVGAAEIIGVTKLLFAQCSTSEAVGIEFNSHIATPITCNISGTDTDDSVITTLNGVQNPCFGASHGYVFSSGEVIVIMRNNCSFKTTFQAGSPIAVQVYDK